MCGISGLWNFNHHDTPKEIFIPFTDAMSHRGPNGRGFYHDPEARLWLGHRRLSILDLSSAASQPMPYLQERYWLTFNGEIYNFLELKKELEAVGYSFKTNSDSEVLLASYHHWKEKCQFKFNGMWAFAIWDREEKKLFLSRDRFGVKPLYYFRDGERFIFASELKAFLSLPFFPLAFDSGVLTQTLADSNGVESTEECFLLNVKRLLPGHSLHMDNQGDLQIKQWWRTEDHLIKASSIWEERVEMFRSLLLDSCRLRMRSDVPIGSAVSGGLDSSAILSLLSEIRRNGAQERIHPEWHRAFIAQYPGTSQDESPFAEEIIRYTQSEAVYCPIDSSHLVENIEALIFSTEEVFDPPLGPWLLYREYRKRGVFISIDGHGADELLGGYHHHVDTACQSALFHPQRFKELREIQKELYPIDSPHSISSFSQLLKKRAQNQLKNHPALYGILKKYFSRNHLHDWLKMPLKMRVFLSRKKDLLNDQLYTDFHDKTLPVILRNFDRSSMAHGIEVRSPFLDWRLVTYAFSLPPEDKIGGGFTKKILREAMKERLPEKIRARKCKVGFASPVVEWMGGLLKPFILDSLNSSSFLQSEIWDGALIRKYVEECYKTQDFREVRACWEFLVAHTLMKQFKSKWKNEIGNFQKTS